MSEEPRIRGLSSLEQSREQRGKLQWPSVRFWGYFGLLLAVSGIIYWKWSQGQLESLRQGLMARQRAVSVELGPRWFPMRDKIEGWTMGLAKDAGNDIVDKEALAKLDFRERAGIYLRMRVQDATSPQAIRMHAKESLRDAFTACVMRVSNPNPLAGKECKKTHECPPGEFCNEADHCSRPAQPFNLRVAYRTMHVLSEEWVREVQDAGTELRLRVLLGSFEDTVRDDIPLAAEFLTRAQYFLLVLDEVPPDAPPTVKGEGAPAVEELQAMPHMARVAVWSLADGKTLLRVRSEASGQLLGADPDVGAEVMAARQRQANSCALALAVRQAMGDPTTPTMAPGIEGAPSPQPAPGASAEPGASAQPATSAQPGASAQPAASAQPR